MKQRFSTSTPEKAALTVQFACWIVSNPPVILH
jgi:hypothetical protein